MNRGDAAAATWKFLGETLRRRRDCDVDTETSRGETGARDEWSRPGAPQVHVTSLAEVHKNYFAKLKPGQLLSEEGLAETSSAMRRWWAAGRVMHEESRDASGDGYDYREDVSVKLAAV